LIKTLVIGALINNCFDKRKAIQLVVWLFC
jgi:hypothetical protein